MGETLRLTFDDDGFATIQMVNGENRFQISTINEWNTVLDKVESNKSVRALLITGTDKFFSNGIDLVWLSSQQGDGPRQFMLKLPELFIRIQLFPVPTAALLNGHAFGAGAFLALACDFRVMRPDRGWLCWPETAIGLRFGDKLLKIAKSKIPCGVIQREALLYSKRLTGNDAKRLGLADDVVEETEMGNKAKQLIYAALGKRGLNREILQAMKKDIYAKDLDISKL